MKTLLSFGFRSSDLILGLCILLASAASAEAATTYFSADNESGTVNPPWGGPSASSTDPTVLSVTNSTERPHTGLRSLRHFDPCGTTGDCPGNGAKVHKFTGLTEAHYSAWFNVAQGFNSPSTNSNGTSNNMFQFKSDNGGTTTVKGGPKIAVHATTTPDGSKRFLTWSITDCELTLADQQALPGYGTQWKNVTEPNGSIRMCNWQEVNPTYIANDRWFHLEYYVKACSV